MLSSFGGTIALGGLISLTLLFGISNLMLLPALVLTLNKTLANEQDFIEPKIDIIEPSDAAIDDLEPENNIRAPSAMLQSSCFKKNRKDFHCYPG
jgi:hypothetical protein